MIERKKDVSYQTRDSIYHEGSFMIGHGYRDVILSVRNADVREKTTEETESAGVSHSREFQHYSLRNLSISELKNLTSTEIWEEFVASIEYKACSTRYNGREDPTYREEVNTDFFVSIEKNIFSFSSKEEFEEFISSLKKLSNSLLKGILPHLYAEPITYTYTFLPMKKEISIQVLYTAESIVFFPSAVIHPKISLSRFQTFEELEKEIKYEKRKQLYFIQELLQATTYERSEDIEKERKENERATLSEVEQKTGWKNITTEKGIRIEISFSNSIFSLTIYYRDAFSLVSQKIPHILNIAAERLKKFIVDNSYLTALIISYRISPNPFYAKYDISSFTSFAKEVEEEITS